MLRLWDFRLFLPKPASWRLCQAKEGFHVRTGTDDMQTTIQRSQQVNAHLVQEVSAEASAPWGLPTTSSGNLHWWAVNELPRSVAVCPAPLCVGEVVSRETHRCSVVLLDVLTHNLPPAVPQVRTSTREHHLLAGGQQPPGPARQPKVISSPNADPMSGLVPGVGAVTTTALPATAMRLPQWSGS